MKLRPIHFLLAALLGGCATRHSSQSVEITRSDAQVNFQRGGRHVFTYNLRPPVNSVLPLEAGGYFHPLKTPGGVVVTDFAPDDHKHHRGLFLAWVEMHGAKDADFWGWGAHAPTRDRRIVNRSVTMTLDGFTALNDWIAEDTVILEEKLEARASSANGAAVLDLVYRLTPKSDLTLSRWAFSGFCLRLRKGGDIRMSSPAGVVSLPNPIHTKPETDWPDARWYASEQTFADGTRFGAAVLNHPSNPPTLWHNHRDTRMINPCIVAPAEVKLKSGEPLVLRYRVVTFDGALSVENMNALTKDWR